MKIVFIVLLIAAVGAGVYLYFSKKQNPHVLPKELIVGKWKIKSATSLIDSLHPTHHYEFLENGNVLMSVDSTKIDTLLYQWKDGTHISWKNKGSDSTIQVLSVLHLNHDSLVMRSKDSIDLVLNRVN